ncbi:hypothetical protein MBLNU459_g6766t2 [Dothideomycetes sp. NU459]
MNNGGTNAKAITITPSSDATSDASSMWSHRSSRSSYDDLYDITEDETEEVPLKLSASVKKQAKAEKEKSRYPSIVIPSPSIWPTIQKLQSACSIGLSPASKIGISPAALATLNARGWQVPSTSSTPSLDGSLTSEELALSSCPSTPDLAECIAAEGQWEAPVQLHPDAFETLHHLAPEDEPVDPVETVINVSEEAIQEMQEIVRDSPVRPEFVLLSVEPSQQQECQEPLSALSIPSPGGFFSSLAPNAARTWSLSPVEPSTSTAETFYDVPWSRKSQAIENSRSTEPSGIDRRLPLRRFLTASDDIMEVSEITDLRSPLDFSENYQRELKEAAVTTFTRTKAWLNAQTTHLNTILEENSRPDPGLVQSPTPLTPDRQICAVSANSSPSGKSVRFVETVKENLSPISEKSTEESEPLFYQGFQHFTKRHQHRDVFIHRQARAEAIQVQRSGFAEKHCRRLRGQYEIMTTNRPAPARPISNFLPRVSDDELKETITMAERERQALEQLKPSVWEVQAAKQVFGGELILSPTSKSAPSFPGKKVLDFGGNVTCSWAWQYALEHRNDTVYTVPAGDKVDSGITGPSNHRVVNVSKLWSLPFQADSFDIISARNLHTFLKTTAPSASPFLPPTDYFSEDEYDLTLRELRRVLKPAGYLEFSIYDAALLQPGPLGQALGVEFAFNLKTRGYDPCASKTFLSRLERAGFLEVRRSWLVLPMADIHPRWTDQGRPSASRSTSTSSASSSDSSSTITPGTAAQEPQTKFYQLQKSGSTGGAPSLYGPPLTGSTKDAKAMTGLVGAGAWEQWMLKLGQEMDVPEGKIMEQLSSALEEGGKSGAGWKCLVGWARK